MPTQVEIMDSVCDFMVQQLEIEKKEISWDVHLMEDLEADSLDIVELVMMIENHYNIEIPDDDVNGLSRYSEIISYLNKRLNPTGPEVSGDGVPDGYFA